MTTTQNHLRDRLTRKQRDRDRAVFEQQLLESVRAYVSGKSRSMSVSVADQDIVSVSTMSVALKIHGRHYGPAGPDPDRFAATWRTVATRQLVAWVRKTADGERPSGSTPELAETADRQRAAITGRTVEQLRSNPSRSVRFVVSDYAATISKPADVLAAERHTRAAESALLSGPEWSHVERFAHGPGLDPVDHADKTRTRATRRAVAWAAATPDPADPGNVTSAERMAYTRATRDAATAVRRQLRAVRTDWTRAVPVDHAERGPAVVPYVERRTSPVLWFGPTCPHGTPIVHTARECGLCTAYAAARVLSTWHTARPVADRVADYVRPGLDPDTYVLGQPVWRDTDPSAVELAWATAERGLSRIADTARATDPDRVAVLSDRGLIPGVGPVTDWTRPDTVTAVPDWTRDQDQDQDTYRPVPYGPYSWTVRGMADQDQEHTYRAAAAAAYRERVPRIHAC